MAKKRGDVRGVITLQCSTCRERNYTSSKNRRNDTQRLELRKFCSKCRGHHLHREVR
ncbi:50S ribosomal protein L33 [SAR202 cluster bacterium AC-409-J13_OGT_754m]|nr:50S ribosomal protein L33 [SAR202 cluster bacterium AC-409-J13_OGT_754m]